MKSKLLLKGGTVLTFDPKVGNLPNGDVLIEEGRIVEIGMGLRARDAELIDAKDTVILPGFVDTHRHAWKSLFRNAGSVIEGQTGGPNALRPHFRPDDVYAATLIGLLGAADSGITTVVDWSDIQFDPDYTDATLQAHLDSGLRTVLVHSAPDPAAAVDQAAILAGLIARRGSAQSVGFGPRQPDQSAIDEVAAEWSEAKELGLRIHAHTSFKPGTVSLLAARGLLGDDVTLIHTSGLDDTDLDAVAARGASVSITPSSEMAAGQSGPPLQKLIDRGIRPGLGIDNEQTAPGDMFAQMRATISLQHATLFDRKLAGKGSLPHLLTTREVIRYATIDGARALGLGAITGSLEPGKQADLIGLRTDRPNIFPINDPIGAVVWGMDTSNLDWVIVSGRPLMSQGKLTADVDRARDLALAAQQRVIAASGVLVGARSGSSA
jgi:cytosine/adenosine deaminase-related metal-dependent hydrolase